MAFTFSDLKDHLKGLFGEKQTRSSGDGGGDVTDHINRLSQRYATYHVPIQPAANKPSYAQTASLSKTQPMSEQVCFVAEEECNVKSIRVAFGRALTTHASDYLTFVFLKRKSTTFSVTQSVATMAGTVANLGATVPIHSSKAATIASTESVIDMDAGDVLTVQVTKTLLGQSTPPFTAMIAVEEK